MNQIDTPVINPPADPASLSIEELIKCLGAVDEDLPRNLAALNKAPAAVADATVSAYRFGTRSMLSGLGLIEQPGEGSGDLHISPRGHQVIATCAQRYTSLDSDVGAALLLAQKQLSHSRVASKLRLKATS